MVIILILKNKKLFPILGKAEGHKRAEKSRNEAKNKSPPCTQMRAAAEETEQTRHTSRTSKHVKRKMTGASSLNSLNSGIGLFYADSGFFDGKNDWG